MLPIHPTTARLEASAPAGNLILVCCFAFQVLGCPGVDHPALSLRVPQPQGTDSKLLAKPFLPRLGLCIGACI